MIVLLCGVLAAGVGTTVACLRARRAHARAQPAPHGYDATWR